MNLSMQQIHMNGTTMNAKVSFKRKWYEVVFDCGMMVKVNPRALYKGLPVQGDNKAVTLKAQECLRELPLKRKRPMLAYALRAGASREEIEWACIQMGMGKEEAREELLRFP